MKNFIVFLSILLTVNVTLKGQTEKLPATNGPINVTASNFCGFIGNPIVTRGDLATGELPTLSFIDYPFLMIGDYYLFDTIRTGRVVKQLIVHAGFVNPAEEVPFYLLDDSAILVYKGFYDWNLTPGYQIIPFDTFYHSLNVAGQFQYNYFHLISENPSLYTIYDSLFTNTVFSQSLDFNPVLLDINNHVAIVGEDSIGTRLKLFNLQNPASPVLLLDTLLPVLSNNPKKLHLEYNKLFIVSCPGDSAIVLTQINLQNYNIVNTVLQSGSSMRIGGWSYDSFFFQPLVDSTGNQNHTKLFKYNSSLGLTLFNINKVISDLFLIPQGYYLFLVDSMLPNELLYYGNSSLNYIGMKSTGTYPYLMEGDFRCSVGIDDYSDEEVSVKAYPNPTTGEINLSLSGLITGKIYLLELIDINGKVLLTREVMAKNNFELDLSPFKNGIYTISLITRQGKKSVKIIKI
jgi:hypothetical protein